MASTEAKVVVMITADSRRVFDKLREAAEIAADVADDMPWREDAQRLPALMNEIAAGLRLTRIKRRR